MDFAEEGLLEDLEGKERDERERLLDELADQGFGLEELRTAVEEDRLVLLPLERLLGGSYTATEMAQRTELPAELLLRIRRASGLPQAGEDERVFIEEDLEVIRSMQHFMEAGMSEEAIIELSRVLGESMARVAASTSATFVDAFLRAGDGEAEVAERFVSLTEQLIPAFEPVFISSFKSHIREAVRRGVLSRAEREAGQLGSQQSVTVCFADVVGFTRLGAELEVEELGDVAGKLAELAAEVTNPKVRLVKTIGDAAMLVSQNPEPLVSATLELLDAFEQADLPMLRAGIAHGPAMLRSGDFFGHSVNLASRVTGVSRPGSVLCTQEVRDAAPEQFRWSFAGKHRLKGVGEPQALHRARPLPEPGEADEDTGGEESGGAPDGDGDGKAKKRRADRRRKRAES